MPDVGLVLSGGGAKGAFGAGVAAGLEEAGIEPRVVSGTSAGALNAAAVASGLGGDLLVELWAGLESRDVYRVRKDLHTLLRPWHLIRHPARLLGMGPHTTTEHLLDTIGWDWLFDTRPLRDRLCDILGGERVPIRDGRVLSVSCINAKTGELVRFANALPPNRPADNYREVELTVDHLLASAAIPGVFRPVEIEDEAFWDGGLIANTPLRAAMPFEPDVVFVVASGAVDRRVETPRSLGQTFALIIDHLMRYSMVEDIDHAETVNELVRAAPGSTYHVEVELIPIAPDREDIGIGHLLDFEPSVAERLIAAGRDAAREALARWGG